MFSAFKKLASKSETPSPGNVSSTAVPMCGSLQKKFSRGVQYNSKQTITVLGNMNNMLNLLSLCSQ